MASVTSLFFAIVPPDDVRGAIEKTVRDMGIRAINGGRLVSPLKYHLTLLHLGEVDTPEIVAAAQRAGGRVQTAPFSFQLDLADCFQNRRVPWWIGPHETSEPLRSLNALLASAAEAEGAPVAGKFVPHVTVVRDAKVTLPRTLPQAIEWPVQDFVLFRSYRQPSKPAYEEIQRWTLEG